MNIYRFRFKCTCPNNGHSIDYHLKIISHQMIEVEEIINVAGKFPASFHEALADAFLHEFGGCQILKAVHQGVGIETRRGTNDF